MTPARPEPTTITYLFGDATAPQGDGPKVIAHVCNDYGGWGAGFVVALSRRWPYPERDYRAWADSGAADWGLGNVRYTLIAGQEIVVANMIAQHGYGESGTPIRYPALEQCLAAVAQYCLDRETGQPWASVHMPRIGCGLAGGRWDQVEPIIKGTLCAVGVPVFVYDLTGPQPLNFHLPA